MRKTMLAVAGLAALALTAWAGTPMWLHVKVDAAGPKATTVRVNLPFTLLDVAAPWAAAEWGKNVKVAGPKGLDKQRLQAMWNAAKEAGDSEFVRVESENEHVRVARVGGRLVIRVEDGGAKGDKVTVDVPGAVADALLSGPGEELDFVAALAALKRAGSTQLVTVEGGKDKVRIWVDDRNVSE